jgi:hypothetical protein
MTEFDARGQWILLRAADHLIREIASEIAHGRSAERVEALIDAAEIIQSLYLPWPPPAGILARIRARIREWLRRLL